MITPNVEILKTEFREFCVKYLVIRNINDIFTSAGIEQGKSEKNLSGDRRSLVEDYYASLNWESMESIRKFVKVLENTLLISGIGDDGKQNLRLLCEKHGFTVDKNGYRVYPTVLGVGNNVKNLIFAATGPKPEIISDSVSNDIEIVKNADSCLIYDRPIKSHGLLWKELVDWWREKEQLNEELDREEVGRKLYVRLRESLDSKPEKLFWRIYFKKF